MIEFEKEGKDKQRNKQQVYQKKKEQATTKKILFSLTTTKVGRHQLKMMSFHLQRVMLVVKNVVFSIILH